MRHRPAYKRVRVDFVNLDAALADAEISSAIFDPCNFECFLQMLSEGVRLNSPEELFPSPLRMDPRPMDGIYHATFVTTRMHRAVKGLIESGILSAAQKDIAEKDLIDNARLFASGIETVDRF